MWTARHLDRRKIGYPCRFCVSMTWIPNGLIALWKVAVSLPVGTNPLFELVLPADWRQWHRWLEYKGKKADLCYNWAMSGDGKMAILHYPIVFFNWVKLNFSRHSVSSQTFKVCRDSYYKHSEITVLIIAASTWISIYGAKKPGSGFHSTICLCFMEFILISVTWDAGKYSASSFSLNCLDLLHLLTEMGQVVIHTLFWRRELVILYHTDLNQCGCIKTLAFSSTSFS